MDSSGHETIGEILTHDIPRDFLLTFESLYQRALEDAHAIASRRAIGHKKSVLGINRHFLLNEALLNAFEEFGILHGPLRGNSALVGQFGRVTLGRLHLGPGGWDNSRRSKAKVRLCERNGAAAQLVQCNLFGAASVVKALTAFLVTDGDERAANVYIVVPDAYMDLRNPVFRESLFEFLHRYEPVEPIVDIAFPELKQGVKRVEQGDGFPT